MALITKTGYEDKYGNTHLSAYAVIDCVTTDKEDGCHTIYLKIFKDKQARDDKMSPLGMEVHSCSCDADFLSKFSCAAITADDNQFKQSYLYLLGLKDENGNLVYDDWESDE